jgi:hypothetical protein
MMKMVIRGRCRSRPVRLFLALDSPMVHFDCSSLSRYAMSPTCFFFFDSPPTIQHSLPLFTRSTTLSEEEEPLHRSTLRGLAWYPATTHQLLLAFKGKPTKGHTRTDLEINSKTILKIIPEND